jgi:hypothetical protein
MYEFIKKRERMPSLEEENEALKNSLNTEKFALLIQVRKLKTTRTKKPA